MPWGLVKEVIKKKLNRSSKKKLKSKQLCMYLVCCCPCLLPVSVAGGSKNVLSPAGHPTSCGREKQAVTSTFVLGIGSTLLACLQKIFVVGWSHDDVLSRALLAGEWTQQSGSGDGHRSFLCKPKGNAPHTVSTELRLLSCLSSYQQQGRGQKLCL